MQDPPDTCTEGSKQDPPDTGIHKHMRIPSRILRTQVYIYTCIHYMQDPPDTQEDPKQDPPDTGVYIYNYTHTQEDPK